MCDTSAISEERLQWIFYYGARPLWRYLAETLDIDITDVCGRVTKEDTFLETEGCKLQARVVDLPHSNELVEDRFNNDVCFLINSINTVFETLKAAVQKDDEFILKNLVFRMDEDHNIYLIDEGTLLPISDKAIAVCML